MKVRTQSIKYAMNALVAFVTLVSFTVAGSGIAAAATTAPTHKMVADIQELGVEFKQPNRLADLGYKVRYIKGDQAPSTVEFTTKRLEAAGCTIDQAPMGMLTYRSDLGGQKLHKVRGSMMYYVKPDGSCHAPARIQQWQLLRTALQNTLKADDQH